MIRVALRGLAGRKLRAFLTALAIVLGVAMVSGTFVLTDMIDRAFDGWVLPILGFFLLPWTTLAYAWMWAVGTNEDQEQVAKAIAGDKVDPEKAGQDWVEENQDKVDAWLN